MTVVTNDRGRKGGEGVRVRGVRVRLRVTKGRAWLGEDGGRT